MKKLLFTFSLILAAHFANAQQGYRDSNRIGIAGGVNYFMLDTDNFKVTPDYGWSIGLSVRGNFYNDWDMVYELQFSENNFIVETTDGFIPEDVKYTLPSAQVSLLFSYKFIENHLSAEIGPMFQINGKAKVAEEQNDNMVTGTSMTAKDLTDFSKFNFFPTVGLTFGVRHFRANVKYQYSVTNMINRLNDQDFGRDFTGRAGIVTGSLIVYL